MTTVACVEVGNYLGLGAEYVRKLRAGVARHLRSAHKFVVLTDSVERHFSLACEFGADIADISAHRSGWWAKLSLFHPGMFPAKERVLYLDLDSIIVGDLQPLVENKGIVHLKDWGWLKNDYCSSVMSWDHGEHAEVWSKAPAQIESKFRGDQDWMTRLGGWPALPVGLAVSYRYVSRVAPPEGARVVQFHGKPKPHEASEGWVKEAWGAL